MDGVNMRHGRDSEGQQLLPFALPESRKEQAVVDLLARGQTIQSVANAVDWSKSRVHRHAGKVQTVHRPRAWIDDKIQKSVEQRLSRGDSARDISREMCVSINTVAKIRRVWLDRGLSLKVKQVTKRRCETCGAIVVVWPCVACAARGRNG